MNTTHIRSRFVLYSLTAFAVACSPDPTATLSQIIAEDWEFRLRENPLFATTAGVNVHNDRLPSVAVADQTRRAAFRRGLLERLTELDSSQLQGQNRINYNMLLRELQDAVTAYDFKAYEIPITVDNGFHIAFARLPNRVPFITAEDYDNYIARLRAFPIYVDQHIALMRDGLARGMTLSRVVLDGYEVTIASHVVSDPKQSVFYTPFDALSTTVPNEDHERLRNDGRRAIEEHVVEAYRTFLRFMVDEYAPNARTTLGASELPNGRAYYEYLVRRFTTLDIAPDDIHQIGLEEVRRIRSEMEAIINQVKFTGTFTEFLTFLRTDPRFYAKTPEELLKQASYIAKQMDGQLPALFKTLPRLPYSVQPVPDHLAPKYTGGRYVGAPVGGTKPGYYWVNTYNLRSRPLYVLEALTFHEAVPGHHLQNALMRELTAIPNFRRFASIAAFGEGWGLYSEWLGREAGFYRDPYSRFGQLTYEMWRACRLVVDTGLHAMGWSREQAMDYLESNTALSLHEIKTETDRYISWPGQALAYKMGELKIRELRRAAEAALGTAFDVRDFHDAILANGPIPLAVLDDQIRAYIADRSGALN